MRGRRYTRVFFFSVLHGFSHILIGSMYAVIFSYHLGDFDGKCRKMCHTWIHWDGQINAIRGGFSAIFWISYHPNWVGNMDSHFDGEHIVLKLGIPGDSKRPFYPQTLEVTNNL